MEMRRYIKVNALQGAYLNMMKRRPWEVVLRAKSFIRCTG